MTSTPISPFKDTALQSRVALITGGASGIGLEIARQIVKHGGRVVLMGRRQPPLEDAVQLMGGFSRASFYRGDVRIPDDARKAVEHAVQHFGKLNMLVNSAAGNFLAVPEELTVKGFKTVMEIDTIGVFNMSRECFSHLQQSGLKCEDPVIINISANLHYGATWFQAHASAAKAAIDSLTRSFALEWGSFHIRTCGIAPGPIGGTAGLSKLAGEMSENQIAQAIPLGRMGARFDIAMAAVFLASTAGSFISGDTIVVDGGQWMWRPQVASREVIQSLARKIEKKSRQQGLAAKL